jgi:hypothetical protein
MLVVNICIFLLLTATVAGSEDGGGGGDLHKADVDKPTMHQEARPLIARNGQNPYLPAACFQ